MSAPSGRPRGDAGDGGWRDFRPVGATAAGRGGMGLPELMITITLVSFIMYFAWEFYFKGQETTRHVGKMSQMQADGRSFLRRIAEDVAMTYAFEKVDDQSKTLQLLRYRVKVPDLEEMVFLPNGTSRRPLNDYNFPASRVTYTCSAEGKVTRKEEPGDIYFHKQPLEFRPNPNLGDTLERELLRHISSWSVRLYRQSYERDANGKVTDVKFELLDGTTATNAVKGTFITLSVRSFIDEFRDRRDEELDIAIKLFSRYRTTVGAYPNYFCSVDDALDY